MIRTTLKFDELNSLSRKRYEEYFDVMGITKDMKTERVLLAMALEDEFIEILSWIQYKKERGEQFFLESMSMFEKAFLAVALTRIGMTEELRATAKNFAEDVALSTYNHQDEDYYLSIDRAINMAGTEANAIDCYAEFAEALERGETQKTWHSLLDGRERKWHHDAHGQTVPIREPFEILGELLMYPLDTSLGATADNIANCRCYLTFS